jgi:hypothetical protein
MHVKHPSAPLVLHAKGGTKTHSKRFPLSLIGLCCAARINEEAVAADTNRGDVTRIQKYRSLFERASTRRVKPPQGP